MVLCTLGEPQREREFESERATERERDREGGREREREREMATSNGYGNEVRAYQSGQVAVPAPWVLDVRGYDKKQRATSAGIIYFLLEKAVRIYIDYWLRIYIDY